MVHVVEDRVAETSTTTGTGNFALLGAIVGFVAFDDVMANADTCFYMIEGVDSAFAPTGEYEVGYGTFNDTDTLVRTTVHRSSNSNALVNFSAGTKIVALVDSAAAIRGGNGWTDLSFGAPVSGVYTANQTFVLAGGDTLECEADLRRVENEGAAIRFTVGANHYRIDAQSDSNLVINRASAAIAATGAIATFEYTGGMTLKFVLMCRAASSNYMYGVHNDYRFPVTTNASDNTHNMVGTATISVTTGASGLLRRARARIK